MKKVFITSGPVHRQIVSFQMTYLISTSRVLTARVLSRLRETDGTPCPGVIKLFSCSTQLSKNIQLLIKTIIPTNLALSLSDVVFIMLINVKMPTFVGILTFMSRMNFVLS